METLAANVSGKTRRATLGGREYLVADATLLVPGVHEGSLGPVYYPPEVLAHDPSAWDYVPLLCCPPPGHPVVNGKYVSGRDPEAVERHWVGNGYRTRADGKLAQELWFEAEAAARVDPRVVRALKKGDPIEVSTGMHLTVNEAPEGSAFNGKPYKFVARGMQPYHLAILMDQPGACSVKDGCGVFNAQMSHDDLRGRLQSLLEKRYGGLLGGCYVIDVFDKEVVYRHGDRTWRVGYSHDLRNGKVGLSAEAPVEVTRVSSYKPVTGGPTMNREETVGWLVANCDCWKDPGDREVLNALPDAKLAALKGAAEKTRQLVANAATPATPAAPPAPSPAPVAVAARPATFQEWMDAAPPEVRAVVQNAQAAEARERQGLLAQLTFNTPAEKREALLARLRQKPLADLRDMAELLPAAQDPAPRHMAPDYSGAAGGVAANAAAPEPDVLPIPTWNYDRKQA